MSNSIYYKVPKTSPTGLKFAGVAARIDKSRDAIGNLAESLGATEYRPSAFGVVGYVHSIFFDTPPSKDAWRSVGKGEYAPRRNTKAGKLVQAQIDAIPKVEFSDLNDCVGIDGKVPGRLFCIGFSFGNQDHWFFSVQSEWGVTMPDDCIETTYTEYSVN